MFELCAVGMYEKALCESQGSILMNNGMNICIPLLRIQTRIGIKNILQCISVALFQERQILPDNVQGKQKKVYELEQ